MQCLFVGGYLTAKVRERAGFSKTFDFVCSVLPKHSCSSRLMLHCRSSLTDTLGRSWGESSLFLGQPDGGKEVCWCRRLEVALAPSRVSYWPLPQLSSVGTRAAMNVDSVEHIGIAPRLCPTEPFNYRNIQKHYTRKKQIWELIPWVAQCPTRNAWHNSIVRELIHQIHLFGSVYDGPILKEGAEETTLEECAAGWEDARPSAECPCRTTCWPKFGTMIPYLRLGFWHHARHQFGAKMFMSYVWSFALLLLHIKISGPKFLCCYPAFNYCTRFLLFAAWFTGANFSQTSMQNTRSLHKILSGILQWLCEKHMFGFLHSFRAYQPYLGQRAY